MSRLVSTFIALTFIALTAVLFSLNGFTGGAAHAAGAVSNCAVRIGLGEGATLSSLQFTVDYTNVQGSFAGSGTSASCSTQLSDASISVNDTCDGDYAACQQGPDRRLAVAILSNAIGFSGPREIANCVFESAQTPSPTDFDVAEVTASVAGAMVDANPTPLLDILSVNCGE